MGDVGEIGGGTVLGSVLRVERGRHVSPSSHIWYGYIFLCQKPPLMVRGWARSCCRRVSMATRYFCSPLLWYRVNSILPALIWSRLYSSFL
jgi:hypothetical protein